MKSDVSDVDLRRPIRDHPTLVTYAQMAAYGWLLYAFGSSVPLLRDDEGTSNQGAALHSSLYALAGILVALSGPRIARSLGRGRALRIGALLITAGAVVYCSGFPVPVSDAGAFVMGLGGGLIVVFTNAHINGHQRAAAPASLAEATMLSAVTGTIAPAALGLGVAIGWGWRPGFLVAAVAFVVIEFFRGSTSDFDDGEAQEQATTAREPLTATYWVACLALAVLVGVEFCLMLWSSDLLRIRGGMGAGAAALSVTAVVGGMAIGRGIGSAIAQRARPEPFLVAVILVALGGVIAAWASSQAVVILLLLLVTGAGVGMHWPLGIARVVRAAGHQTDHAVSYAVAMVGVASGLAPFILGSVADATGVVTAYLVIPVLLIIALVLVLVNRIPAEYS